MMNESDVALLGVVLSSMLGGDATVPLNQRPPVEIREAASSLQKVCEDYLDTRTIMVQVSPNIVPDDMRIIQQAINTNGEDYEFSDEIRRVIVAAAFKLLDASEALLKRMGPAPSKTQLIESSPSPSGSSSSSAAANDAQYDIPRRVALGVARQYVVDHPDATLEELNAELTRRNVRKHLPEGDAPLRDFLNEAGIDF